MISDRSNMRISYGRSGEDLLVVIHPSNEMPEQDEETYRTNFHATRFVRDSSLDDVCELFEDFLLNSRRHFPSSGFVGLKTRASRRFGMDVDPHRVTPSDLPTGELYPGLMKIHLGNQIVYILEGQGSLPLDSYLPYDFNYRARKLAE